MFSQENHNFMIFEEFQVVLGYLRTAVCTMIKFNNYKIQELFRQIVVFYVPVCTN